MKWYDQLYIGDSIRKKASRIRWKVEHNAGTFTVHIITFPSNSENLLDIIPARELLQKGYPKKNLYIVGLAGNYDEAIEVVTDIINECLTQTGTCDVKRYLLGKDGQI